jgi:hypothetical protein
MFSLALRGKHKYRMSGNKKVRIIFGPKMEEVTGGWKMHNDQLHNWEDQIGKIC